MSSPHYPQSNGHAEAAVKAMKSLLKKSSPSGHINSDEFQRGLLEWRNTPSSDGQSPAQILLGRQLRSDIPSGCERDDSGVFVTVCSRDSLRWDVEASMPIPVSSSPPEEAPALVIGIVDEVFERNGQNRANLKQFTTAPCEGLM